jgi:hypothetical protein
MNPYALYLALTLFALGADTATAQSSSERAGTWDFGITMTDQSSNATESASFDVWKLELLWQF